MQRWKIWCAALALFVGGCAVGLVIGKVFIMGPPPFPPGPDHHISPDRMMLEMLDRELDLDDKQKEQVHAVVRRITDKMSVIMRENFPREDAIFQEESPNIKALLRPDQQKRYEIFSRRMRERRMEMIGEKERRPK